MDDYISREAAISEIMSEPTDAHYPSWYAEKLKQIPAADVVKVVRGRWEIMSDPRFRRCSVCHDKVVFNMKNLPNFCDVCGADMREPNLDTTKGERRDESIG